MSRNTPLALLFTFALLLSTVAVAQGPCPVASRGTSLICLVPQLYSPNGLNNPALVDTGHAAHFQEASFENSNAINSSIGSQLTLLPIASPASGFVAAWNPSLGIYEQSSESFGPVLSERSETIGRHHLHLGASYQYFPFSSLDGIDLKNIPAVFKHIDLAPCTSGLPGGQFGICPQPNNDPNGQPAFEREVINTTNRVDIKLHQVTGFATFGLTNRIDVSLAVPIESVRMGVVSNATIVPSAQPTTGSFFHAFQPSPTCPNPVIATNVRTGVANVPGCLTGTFSSSNSASGIGDITLRVKGTAWRSEKQGVALGMDFRLPTGDEQNFLGSGAFGVRPFVAWSYRARVSPHVNLGYEWNGQSILAGTVTPGVEPTKGNLPRLLLYSAGFDAGVTKKLTFAFDFVGEHLFNAPRVSIVNFSFFPCPTPSSTSGCPDLAQSRGTTNIKSASLGLKYSPVQRFLITGDVLLKLNEGGLRAKAIPLIGLSYLF